MRIGEYRIVIQNMTGEVLAEVDRTTATGHPAVGEEIVLDGFVYVVERVRHEDDPAARATRRYTAPCLFVRRRDGVTRGRRKDAQRAPPRVLPLGGSRRRRMRGTSTVILPPSLVALIVAAGYDAQVRHFQRRSRNGARLSRVGQGWFLEAGESPADCLALAREARKQRRRAEQLLSWLAARAPFSSGDDAHDPAPATEDVVYVHHGGEAMHTFYAAEAGDSTWSGEEPEAGDSTFADASDRHALEAVLDARFETDRDREREEDATYAASCDRTESDRPVARAPPTSP